MKFKPNVIDSPDSNEFPKLNRLEEKTLLISILLDSFLLFFISWGLNLKDSFGSKVLNVVEFFLISGNEALYVYALINSDCGLFLYVGLFLPTVLIFFKAISKFVLIPLSKNLPKAE